MVRGLSVSIQNNMSFMKTKVLGSERNVGWPESYTTAFLDLSIRSENQVTYLLTYSENLGQRSTVGTN